MWERIEKHTYRMKVPNGWIVRYTDYYSGSSCYGGSVSTHMIFIEDKNHEWKIKNES